MTIKRPSAGLDYTKGIKVENICQRGAILQPPSGHFREIAKYEVLGLSFDKKYFTILPPESLDNKHIASDWDLGLYSESDEENCETDVVATLDHEMSSDKLSIIEELNENDIEDSQPFGQNEVVHYKRENICDNHNGTENKFCGAINKE